MLCSPYQKGTAYSEITNIGGSAESCNVILKINGTEEAKLEVTLNPVAGEEIAFTVAITEAAAYYVDVNGLKGSFIVRERIISVIPPWGGPHL